MIAPRNIDHITILSPIESCEVKLINELRNVLAEHLRFQKLVHKGIF